MRGAGIGGSSSANGMYGMPVFNISMDALRYPLHIVFIMKQYGKSVFPEEEGAVIDLPPEQHGGAPLPFVFGKLDRLLGEQSKVIEYQEDQEYVGLGFQSKFLI